MTVAEDSGASALGIAAPTDVDGDPLTITVTGIPNAAVGTVYLSDGTTPVTNGMTLTGAQLTGLLFRPVADANGAAGSFSYTVNDGNGGSDSQTVTLTVTPVNDAPIADADKTVTVAEDSGNSALGIAAPTDIDGDPLTITVTGIPNAAVGTVYLSDGTTAGHQRHDADLGRAHGPAVPPRRRRQRRRRLVQLHRQRRQRRHRQPDRCVERDAGE